MSGNILTTAACGLLLTSLYFVTRWFDRRNRSTLPPPPGPKGWPLIGNVFDLPTKDEYRVYSQWHETYGDICSVTVLGQRVVIINSPDAAFKLLNKQIYASRPHYNMCCDLVGWSDALVMLPYGERFKGYRAMLKNAFGSRASVEKYKGTMETETHQCLARLLNQEGSTNFTGPIRRAIGAILLGITHGYEVQSEHDSLVRIADQATDQLGVLLTPGSFMVDTISALRFIPTWFPGPLADFKRLARDWRSDLYGLTEQSYAFVKKQVSAGTASPSFVQELIEGKDLTEQEELDIKWVASSIYLGGADMPVSALSSLMLAMVMFPEMQKKAQAEIDAVVGHDRLPLFSDRDDLPYVESMLREIIRFGPPVPLGAPHCVTEDDVYEGMLIPKNSIVVANLWHFLQDPNVYPNPEVFDPERFIAREGKPAQPDPYEFCFGFGRRICPGVHLTDAQMYIFTASILSVFNIEKVVENGVVQEPKHEFTSGVLIRPKPFKAVLKPRSAKAEALIRMYGDTA